MTMENNSKRLLWIATDIQYDCQRCCFKDERDTCGKPCETMARKLSVAFTYGVVIKEQTKEYQGG